MVVIRKRFRIEEFQSVTGEVPSAAADGGDIAPFHHEIVQELRGIREQMAKSQRGSPAVSTLENDAAIAMIESYRAQIEQCEKLKVELDLIHAAIDRTKQEIAALHSKSFDGDEMARVTDELGAVVGGTEQATQRILEAVEGIDEAASALTKSSPDQQALLTADIQDRVISIFEACNFQDLTGQRISKVMTTMKFIEHHINVMMDIWGGVDAIRDHAPPIIDTREGDARLLNGPKSEGDEGHASQDDIDALFG
jgi:chemotaxis protein CheZ